MVLPSLATRALHIRSLALGSWPSDFGYIGHVSCYHDSKCHLLFRVPCHVSRGYRFKLFRSTGHVSSWLMRHMSDLFFTLRKVYWQIWHHLFLFSSSSLFICIVFLSFDKQKSDRINTLLCAHLRCGKAGIFVIKGKDNQMFRAFGIFIIRPSMQLSIRDTWREREDDKKGSTSRCKRNA